MRIARLFTIFRRARGVCSTPLYADPPMNRQTLVKILPCLKLRLRMVTMPDIYKYFQLSFSMLKCIPIFQINQRQKSPPV